MRGGRESVLVAMYGLLRDGSGEGLFVFEIGQSLICIREIGWIVGEGRRDEAFLGRYFIDAGLGCDVAGGAKTWERTFECMPQGCQKKRLCNRKNEVNRRGWQ